MKTINSIALMVGMVAVVLAGYSANVAAADQKVFPDSPEGVVVEGEDVTFDWYLSGDVVPQSRFRLVTSAGFVQEDTSKTEVTLPNFPYGYGWWWVEVYKGVLKWKYGETSAIPFHHQFPADWPGFPYSAKFESPRRIKFFELQKDIIINLSKQFLVPEKLPDDSEGEAQFFESWSKNVSDPFMNWDFIRFDKGVLTIKQGYRWDGASYPCKDFTIGPHCIDDTYNIYSSLVHDALYDLMRMEYLVWDSTEPPLSKEACDNKGFLVGYYNRKMADMLLYMIAIEQGQPKDLIINPMHSWAFPEAILNFRGAEQDWNLMRKDIVAPATCEDERLNEWKYHVSELTAPASVEQVELKWKPANDSGREPESHPALTLPHPGYDILRNGVVIDSVPSDSTSYTDNTVANGSTYVYQIARLDYADWDDYSNTVEVTVISSEEAITAINNYIQDLPGDAFKKNPEQRKNAFSRKLDAVIKLVDAGEYQVAIDKLQNEIRAKTDGYVDGNPNDDWITDLEAQEDICAMIDVLIAYFKTLL